MSEWIEWTGGDCPVEHGTLVDVKYRDGEVVCGVKARHSYHYSEFPRDAGPAFWSHDGQNNDIVAYRLHERRVSEEPVPQLRRKSDWPDIVDAVNTAPTAQSILRRAADLIEERAVQRDQPSGEKSMAKTVQAFNAIYGTQLTEVQGWHFMELLKMVRSAYGHYVADDYEDKVAYAALAAEAAK